MRATILSLAVLVVPARASAESFVEVAGGLMMPAGDDDWADYVEPGPKFAVRVGGTGSNGGRSGAMVSADWSPIQNDDTGFGNAVEVSSDRFRVLLGAFTNVLVGPKLSANIRVGAGVDISHVNIKTNLGPLSSEGSDTDPGFALEAGAGLWFDVGSVQVGGEIALPLGFHADGSDNDIDLNDYMSYDIDLLFAVRMISR
jgi:hypothetical protein